MAEAYWDLEWELQQQGFDYCYDKRLYDRLEHGDVNGVRQHLCADLAYQSKLVRFLENHDEPRAAATFQPHRHRAAAVTVLTLPGAKLLYEGQFEGLKTRLPVFLARRPAESPDRDFERFYRQLLDATAQEPLRSGDWTLCECRGWADNPSCQSLLAWCWNKADARCLVIVNFSDSPAQAMVKLPWGDLAKNRWVLKDSLSGDKYDRDGKEMAAAGLYVSLEPWRWHFFNLEAMK
jgi:hypothetical protein